MSDATPAHVGGPTTPSQVAEAKSEHAHVGAAHPHHEHVADEYTTIEALVRRQLSSALGGRRGIVEGALPTLTFTLSWVIARNLTLSLVLSCGLAVLLLVVRIVQRSTVQYVLNAAVGIGIAAVFALKSGRAEDAFLPGLLYNGAYALVLVGSAVIRWPLVGFVIGSVTGDPTGWRRDKNLVNLCTKLTLILAVPCVLRLLVQYPLWASHEAGWLGVAKLAMGWPLQLAALAAMAWVLNRDSTPVPVHGATESGVPDSDPA